MPKRNRIPVTYVRSYHVQFHVAFESTVKIVEQQDQGSGAPDDERIYPTHWNVSKTCTMGDHSWIEFEHADCEPFDSKQLMEVTRKLQLLDDACAAMTEGTKAEGAK